MLIPQENVNDESVTLVAWCVAHGEHVQEGQELAEVEGSKAVFGIPAPVAGIVQYTREVGQEIAVGEILCTISSAAPVTMASDSTASATPSTSRLPRLPDQDRTPDTPSGTPRFSRQAAARGNCLAVGCRPRGHLG